MTITGRAMDLCVSADFLQAVGAWNYDSSTTDGKTDQEVTATLHEDGSVTAFGEKVNYAAEMKVKELLSVQA